jgi:ribosome recycling factor
MNQEQIIRELEDHLGERLEKLKQDLQGIRTNRPSPELVENILVPYFEQKLPIKQLGSLSIKPPREIIVQVWDEQIISSVVKAIEEAKLGLTVQRDEHVIRAFLPPLTDERRLELGKVIKKMAEEVRIGTRTLRDDSNKKIKVAESEKTITEDQLFKAKEKIQMIIDKNNQQIDQLVEKKLHELSS